MWLKKNVLIHIFLMIFFSIYVLATISFSIDGNYNVEMVNS